MRVSLLIGITVCLSALRAFAGDAVPQFSAADEEFFEKKIRPVLVESCYECHSAKKQESGVRLDHRTFMMKGGDNGPLIAPGKVDQSRLWEVVQYDPLDVQMPPAGKLAEPVLADLKRWIELGAPWPANDKPVELGTSAPDWKAHWAYQPIARPAPPQTHTPDWAVNNVDRFVLAKLEAADLKPSPEADRRVLIKRLKYDLLGLPPTFEEVENFVGDTSPDAYARLVESYMNSLHFGERWARHWLDLSRYSDTKGYVFTQDRNYYDAWKFRDWVITAFNRDLPYDRFVELQIAADQFSEDPADLHAMGFLTLGRRFINNKHDIIDDRIDVVTRGLMALTVTCARCHDHKYDPIPSADYYSLYGVFDSSDEPNNEPSTLRLVDRDKPREPHIFRRGSPRNRGKQVPRQFLQVVAREDRKPFEHGSGRKEMAEAIVAADNPLTARVWVNRVWGHLIGKSLVRTSSDFGVRCDPPSHPELLDYLAGRLIDGGWSTKALIREIVLSRTYRQSSLPPAGIEEIDSENALLSHMNRKRADFEGLRDAMLAVAGRLDDTLGGKPIQIETQAQQRRRTIYSFVDRQNLPEVFRIFDFASPDTHAPKRYETNVPQQALFLLNSPFAMEQAQALAARANSHDSAEARIRELYRLTYARDPSADEIAACKRYVEAAPEAEPPAVQSLWSYGYGEVDPDAGQLKSFTPLPHFTGSAWQGGGQLPDGKLGWVTLNATGGHVGNDLQHAAVRRWTSPENGTLSIRGSLKHATGEGDGVRARILIDGADQKGVWDVHNNRTRTIAENIPVKRGDTVDFVTDLKGTNSHDSFEWKVRLKLDVSAEKQLEASSERDFRGPAPTPLQPWAQLAQILLLSNEFEFID